MKMETREIIEISSEGLQSSAAIPALGSKWCERRESNPHEQMLTSTSGWRVYRSATIAQSTSLLVVVLNLQHHVRTGNTVMLWAHARVYLPIRVVQTRRCASPTTERTTTNSLLTTC